MPSYTQMHGLFGLTDEINTLDESASVHLLTRSIDSYPELKGLPFSGTHNEKDEVIMGMLIDSPHLMRDIYPLLNQTIVNNVINFFPDSFNGVPDHLQTKELAITAAAKGNTYTFFEMPKKFKVDIDVILSYIKAHGIERPLSERSGFGYMDDKPLSNWKFISAQIDSLDDQSKLFEKALEQGIELDLNDFMREAPGEQAYFNPWLTHPAIGAIGTSTPIFTATMTAMQTNSSGCNSIVSGDTTLTYVNGVLQTEVEHDSQDK